MESTQTETTETVINSSFLIVYDYVDTRVKSNIK